MWVVLRAGARTVVPHREPDPRCDLRVEAARCKSQWSHRRGRRTRGAAHLRAPVANEPLYEQAFNTCGVYPLGVYTGGLLISNPPRKMKPVQP